MSNCETINSNMQKIKSHVYIPESILNRFSYRDKDKRIMIDYLDLNDMKIYSSTTKKFNREEGYYCGTVEKILKDCAEDKIGNVIYRLEEARKNKEKIILSTKELDSIYSFITYQWLRNDVICKAIMKEEGYKGSVRNFKNANIYVESQLNITKTVAKDMDIVIYFNNTKSNFVLPSNFTYTWNPNSKDMYIMYANLSAKLSLAFCAKGTVKQLSKRNKSYYIIKIKDHKFIDDLNVKAALIDKKNSSMFIVGYYEDLNYIIKTIDENKIKL